MDSGVFGRAAQLIPVEGGVAGDERFRKDREGMFRGFLPWKGHVFWH